MVSKFNLISTNAQQRTENINFIVVETFCHVVFLASIYKQGEYFLSRYFFLIT